MANIMCLYSVQTQAAIQISSMTFHYAEHL